MACQRPPQKPLRRPAPRPPWPGVVWLWGGWVGRGDEKKGCHVFPLQKMHRSLGRLKEGTRDCIHSSNPPTPTQSTPPHAHSRPCSPPPSTSTACTQGYVAGAQPQTPSASQRGRQTKEGQTLGGGENPTQWHPHTKETHNGQQRQGQGQGGEEEED